MAASSFTLGGERPEWPEAKKEFGRNVHILASFRRHGIPAKDPETGKSLDQLTPAGIEQAQQIGAGLEIAGGLKVYASPKERAKQTAVEMAEAAAEQGARIINQGLEGGELKAREKDDLETVTLGSEANRLIKEQGLDGFVKEWLTRKDLGDGTAPVENAAAELAARVDVYQRMSGRLYTNSDVRLENITHGPKGEAFISEVAKVVDKEGRPLVGWDKLVALGGTFKPGEGFEIDIRRPEKDKSPELKILFRGQELEIDQKRLAELVELHRKMEAEKKEKK